MSEPHRKKIRHYESAMQIHELTFSCFQRRPLLTNDLWRTILARSLDSACQEEHFDLLAFVFMPEHVHLLVLPRTANARVSRFLARTKQPTSKQIRQLLEARSSRLLEQLTVRERPGKYCFRFWKEGAGFDRNLFSSQAITASVGYIHMNPVKRNLCQRAVDFKWSSARFHLNQTVDPDLPTLIRSDPAWFDPTGIQKEHS